MAKTILIAEDNEDDALAIGQALRNAGIKNSLKIVEDGTEVIAYFSEKGPYWDREKFPIPSVLLLDLKMPKIGGFAVLEWFKDRKLIRKDTLVVVLTGHGDVGNAQRAYSLGARSFLPKPCTMEDVRNLVRAYPLYWETQDAKE